MIVLKMPLLLHHTLYKSTMMFPPQSPSTPLIFIANICWESVSCNSLPPEYADRLFYIENTKALRFKHCVYIHIYIYTGTRNSAIIVQVPIATAAYSMVPLYNVIVSLCETIIITLRKGIRACFNQVDCPAIIFTK